ncbi:MAG: molybdate ABC transporter substrate-binding protein [Alphaproteobacteria bacterium]|nr:molybdate ABC transporter substrate-binding protein [Alphaproteobacteria bacterium]
MMYPMKSTVGVLAAVWLALGSPATAQTPSGDTLMFAATSLKDALDSVTAQWRTETGKRVVVSYATSPSLARQIEQGAPAQIFISADLDWMDYLSGKSLIKPESRFNLLSNRIVLVAPKTSAATTKIEPDFPLAALLGTGRLAITDVAAAPAGKYARAALEKLGVWASVSNKLAQTENVRAALLLVSRGEAPLGIVYRTDAAVDQGVKILGVFPEATHPPIIYPVALTAGTANPGASAFLAYLKSPAARPLFVAQGFTVLD